MPDTMRRTCTRFKIAFLILEVALESTFFLLEMSGFTQSLRYSEYGCVIMSILDFPTLLIPNGDENPSQRRWAAVKVTQSCPTLWDPMDYTVHGILQARILEWVAYPFFSVFEDKGKILLSLIRGGLRSDSHPLQGLSSSS